MEDIHDIRGPIEIISWWMEALPYALAAVLLVAITILYRYLSKKIDSRKKRVREKMGQMIQLSPYERTKAALEEARELMIEGYDKELAVGLSEPIRIYIEEEFDIHAPEKTTEEFLLEAQESRIFIGKPLETLATFLDMCDMAKFAKQQFTPYAQEKMYEKAMDLLETIHQLKGNQVKVEVSVK